MFEDALGYPLEGDSIEPLAIGSILLLFSWLLIPVIPVAGYLIRVINRSASGEKTPPAFDDWGELFKNGIFAIVIGIVYNLIPTIVAIGIFMTLGGVGLLTGDAGAGIASMLMGLAGAFLAASVLYLIAMYFVPAALANFAETDRFGAAFSLGRIKDICLSGSYAKAWIMAFIIVFAANFVANIILGILSFIPILGTIVGGLIAVPIVFYGTMAAYFLYGRGVAGAN